MGEERLPTIEEAVEELKRKPVVDLWPTLAVAYGVSKGTIYAMAQRGEVDVLRAGRLKKAISASERRKLGIERYLHEQARMNPGHFMTLLGKVLPLQVAGDKDAPLNSRVTVAWESVGPKVEWESASQTKDKADEQKN